MTSTKGKRKIKTAPKPNGVLLPYQAAWLADKSVVKVVEKSRRVGLSWAEAADAVLMAAAADGMDYWYIGYNQEMAREFVLDAAEWAKAYHLAASEVGEIVYDDESKAILAYRLTFASGYRVTALSSRPTNLRGKQGVACIDEAAFHDDLDGLLKAAMALLMWGGKVRVISTHNGDANPFHQLIQDIRAGKTSYSLHRITLDDALAQGLYRRICLKLGRQYSPKAEAEWRASLVADYRDNADEELFCIPAQGSGRWLTRAIIEARMKPGPVLRLTYPVGYELLPEAQRAQETHNWLATHLDPVLMALDGDLPSHFGMDVGREHDLSVIVPCQVNRMLVRRVPFVLEMRRVPFAQQRQVLFHLAERLPRFSGGAVDAGGLGAQLAEETASRFGGGLIHRVKLSEAWYRDHMPPLRAAFEDASLELPKDADLLADLMSLRVVKGIPKPPDRPGKGMDGQQRHADGAVAVVMSYFASLQNPVAYDWTPVASADDDDRRGWYPGGRNNWRTGGNRW